MFPHSWQDYFWLVFTGAMAFNLTASIVYIFNDIKDVKYDRKHPVKKYRPLAAKKLTLIEGYALMITLLGLEFILLGSLKIPLLTLLLLSYFIANYFYSSWIKHIPYVDVIMVAIFSVMRVVAGFVILGQPVAWYIALLTFSIVAFTLMLQRMAELQIVSRVKGNTRPSLMGYSNRLLKLLITSMMILSVMMYFVTTAIIMPELMFTDLLYFAILYTSFQEVYIGRYKEGVVAILRSQKTVVLLTLLILTIITLVVWFR